MLLFPASRLVAKCIAVLIAYVISIPGANMDISLENLNEKLATIKQQRDDLIK